MAENAQNELASELERLRALVAQSQRQQGELREQIVEAHQVGENLWQSNQQLRALLRGMFDGYLTLDSDWRVTAANLPRTEERPNAPQEFDLLGRVLWDIFPDAVNTAAYRELRRARAERTLVEFEHHDSRWNIWIAVRAYPFQNFLHVCYHDITDRKRSEEQRLAYERRLADAKKWESLAALAGGLAHDFNNLLSAIMGHTGLARMDLPADTPARVHLEGIEAAARRVALLTNQLLAYAGKARFVVGRLEINTVVAEAVVMLSSILSRNTTLQENLAAGLPPIEADSDQLRQVVFDLLANAAEAIGPKPGGLITLRTSLHYADHSLLAQTLLGDELAEGDYILLEVADNGCGMDMATLTRMFDPFFSTKFTGRGLGLAAVLGIVRKCRGTLRVDSSPERGTTVQVWLPVAREPDERS